MLICLILHSVERYDLGTMCDKGREGSEIDKKSRNLIYERHL